MVRMVDEFCNISVGNMPIIASVIHNGHSVRSEVAEKLNISELDRLREEDPYTSEWTGVSDTKIICNRSRFEVDLNRVRKEAVYISSEDAWGLQVWKQKPSRGFIKRSLIQYDEFYHGIREVLLGMESKFGHFVLLDLHSYNYLRDGSNTLPGKLSLLTAFWLYASVIIF
ncbi:N-formylglutamate amidohydrolase [Chloroflexota bacterium]